MSRLKDPSLFILGVDAKVQPTTLPGGKLPTFRQVLVCYISRKSKSKRLKKQKVMFKEACDLRDEEIKKLYKQANIPLRDDKTIAKEIVQLSKDLHELEKIPHKRRDSDTSQQRINDFKLKLDKTMPLWVSNALDVIPVPEDKQFLISMMGDRKATMAGVDKITAATVKKVQERKLAELKRQTSEEERKVKCVSVPTPDPQEDELDCEVIQDAEYTDIALNRKRSQGTEDEYTNMEPKRKHRRTKKTGQMVFMRYDLTRSEEIMSAAVRNKVTPTALAALATAIVKSCGGDVSKFNLQHTQSYR